MAEADLAERIGVARSTLQKIEKGAPQVEIGLVFEAAIITGVPLFVPDDTSLVPHIERVSDKLALMPTYIRKTTEDEVKDDF